MTDQKKHILVLGAGFAGLHTALALAKNLRKDDYQILLVDEKPVHVYTPDLYEIATAFHAEITEECLTQLKETVATPLSTILQKTPIQFQRDRVMAIRPAKNAVELQNSGSISFQYLVLALGSVVNYYDIPGLRQFSYPLKTLTDALAITCHLDYYFHTLWKKELKREINVIIGGGGATGVEFACELPGYFERLCKKYHYPREHVHITLIEASSELTGQGENASAFIVKRLEHFGIHVLLNTYIREVNPNSITVESKEKQKLPMDILIWTGGVTAHPLIREHFSEVAKNGALLVNHFLESTEYPYVYAAGDNAAFLDPKSKKPLPMLAQIAVQEGTTVAHNIAADIQGRPKKPFQPHFKGVIIPLGGRYALLKRGNFVFRGFFVWLLRRLVDLWYAFSILPFVFALKKWIRSTEVFVKND